MGIEQDFNQLLVDHDAADAAKAEDAKKVIGTLSVLVAALLKQLHPEPNPERTLLFGYATDNIPDSLAVLGYPEIGRQFQSPGNWNVDWDAYINVNIDRLVLSVKPDMVACANGNAAEIDKVVQVAKDGLERGMELWYIVYHEPEDNIKRGEFTAQQFRQAQINIAHALPDDPRLHPTICLMAYSTLPSAGRNIADYCNQAVADAGVEVLAWDYYINEGDMPYFQEKAVDYAQSLGMGWGIAEFSADYQLAPEPTRDQDMVEVVNFIVDYCTQEGAQFIQWFDEYKVDSEPDAVDWRIRTLPNATAAWLLAQD